MDVGSIGNLSSAVSLGTTSDAVGIQVLKKALDIESQNAMQLINSIPSTNNPAHLGNGVDVKA